ncbi:hypothetical protein CQZ93_24955 [Ochrobactrum vermis]|nr:hypothetical protein CQZ93_24955 [Ochrobactrum vermis]
MDPFDVEPADQHERSDDTDTGAGCRFGERAEEKIGGEEQRASGALISRWRLHRHRCISRPDGHLPEEQAAQNIGHDDPPNPDSAEHGKARILRSETDRSASERDRQRNCQAYHLREERASASGCDQPE